MNPEDHSAALAPDPKPNGGARRGTADGLLPHHREHLRASGLTDATIEKSGAWSVTDVAEAFRMLNLWPGAEVDVPALAFPYPGILEHVRLRPDCSRRRNPDYEGRTGHSTFVHDDTPESVAGPKYLSPRGQPTRLYAVTALRPEILDPSEPLWLVEGEKKALAACQSGLAAVAAPGVTCFGDSEMRRWGEGIGGDVRKLHPDFARLHITVKGRQVIIVFDTDIDTNPNVLRAAGVLGKMLHAAEADVHIAYINPTTAAEKVGLDDYLAALPDTERAGSHPLGAIEDSVRPFNVEDCLNEYLRDNWDDWTKKERERELRRAVRLACHIMPDGRSRKKWLQRAAKKLHQDLDLLLSFVVDVRKASERDPREWVAQWVARQQVTVGSGDQFLVRGKTTDSDVIFREMALDAVTYGGPTRQSLDDAMTTWRAKEFQARLALLRDQVRFQPGLGDGGLAKFARACTGAEDPVDIAVLAHFIWQVKRKLFDLEVVRHLMAIFCGHQGGGKSTAVRALFAPVLEFVDLFSDMTILSDERQLFRFARSLVAFVDEMPMAKRLDVACLKSRITAPTVQWRVLGANRQSKDTNRATLIGTSNYDIQDLIIDSTGVRRFYQVSCLEQMDWEVINALDYRALWAAVDENAACPILLVQEELSKRQDAMRVKDAVEEFLGARCIIGGEDVTGDAKWTGATELYDGFRRFLVDDNRPRDWWTSAKFGRFLKKLVGPKHWKTSNGIKYNVTLKNGILGSELDEHTAEFNRATRTAHLRVVEA